MHRLQDWPHLLELGYSATQRLLSAFRPWLRLGSWTEHALVLLEKVSKGAVFDCRMCGQCVLHRTGMTCPMTCPKHLRNGPCGGVRPDGGCEIIPGMPCIWLQAWERSRRMPTYGSEILEVLPPLDRRLEGTSAWINEFSGAAADPPAGWVA